MVRSRKKLKTSSMRYDTLSAKSEIVPIGAMGVSKALRIPFWPIPPRKSAPRSLGRPWTAPAVRYSSASNRIRVGRASGFAVEQIIPLIDAVDEDDARLRVVIG